MPSNPETTIFCGSLHDDVTERILYDIMAQAGPLVDVFIPRDKETQKSRGFGFAEFEDPTSAQYALRLFDGLVTLFGKPVRFSMSTQRKSQPGGDVAGAGAAPSAAGGGPHAFGRSSSLSQSSILERQSMLSRDSSNGASFGAPMSPPSSSGPAAQLQQQLIHQQQQQQWAAVLAYQQQMLMMAQQGGRSGMPAGFPHSNSASALPGAAFQQSWFSAPSAMSGRRA
eukprot:TRINITY_DN17285_c0_g1_i1.p1 TRINITY_DN17285_c0_g1~~TRINITY_DN17285_c0_g1_i1.p1  ORF type:complete len:226 (-),score=52.89 TRINITY_DN17285_c0_g1_i1:331-1008(-)